LVVLAHNACLSDPAKNFNPISMLLNSSNQTLNGLLQQAYAWTLERDYTEEELNALAQRDPCVEGISWNQRYTLNAAFTDPQVSAQKHLSATHLETAWDGFYGVNGMDPEGDVPVVIAVVDSGVDWAHPDLRDHIWKHESGVGLDATTVGTSSVSYNPTDISSVGHGTHVSGLIAAVPNNGRGGVGAMPYRARIMAIKAFRLNANNELESTSQYIYNAVKFAYQNGAHVINLSLFGNSAGPYTDALQAQAMREAVAAGSTVAIAIGNRVSGKDINGGHVDGVNLVALPADNSKLEGVLSVGSFDSDTGSKSAFSQYGKVSTEIAAPGAVNSTTGIYSTVPTSLGSYSRMAGTSQATPLVAAAAGLTIGLIREAYGAPPTPKEVERLLLAGSEKSTALTPYFKDGNRLDFNKLLLEIHKEYPKTADRNLSVKSAACP